MTVNEYQQEAMRTKNLKLDRMQTLMDGLTGVCMEAGESLSLLNKHLFQGHDLDVTHLAKELGDIAWYLAISADAIGYDLETICRMNINKLRVRYPDGFDPQRSIHRKKGDI